MDRRIRIRWILVATAGFAAGALGVGLFGAATLSHLEVRRDDAVAGPASRPATKVSESASGTAARSAPPIAQPSPHQGSAPSSPPDAAKSAQLEVRRVVVTRGIEGREPAAPTAIEADGQPTYAFVELRNEAPEEKTIVVRFDGEGHSVGHVRLRVPGEQQRWRTWALTRHIGTPGDWTAIVSTEDGRTLAQESFQVTQASARHEVLQQVSSASEKRPPPEA